jgi:hypothetical protein
MDSNIRDPSSFPQDIYLDTVPSTTTLTTVKPEGCIDPYNIDSKGDLEQRELDKEEDAPVRTPPPTGIRRFFLFAGYGLACLCSFYKKK